MTKLILKLMDINKLVEQYPNDMELGAAVRQIYWENKNRVDELTQKMEGAKIFESPDGGKTVYVRDFGQDPRERTLVENVNQLNLFN
jgi:hypothetical protein